MATAEECSKALDELLARLSQMDERARAAKLADRTLSCRVTDLGLIYLTRLGPHGAGPLTEAGPDSPRAQVRFSGMSDDIVAIAADPGGFARAWLTGRVRVEASLMDLLSLRKML